MPFFGYSICFSKSIELKSAADNVIAADFYLGTNDASPVLILHGFLQTNKFSIVDRLANALVDLDYIVFNPTFSPGFSNRK
jgi:esterase/lipase